MMNEQRIDSFIKIQEQCNHVCKNPMTRQEICETFPALKILLIQELPESKGKCVELERLLAAPQLEPGELSDSLADFSGTVFKLCTRELSAALSGDTYIERPVAEKIFHFLDITPHTSLEWYQLAFDTCTKCSCSAPAEAFQRTMRILEEQPGLLSGKKLSHPGYRYQPSEQHTFEQCPICGGEGVPYFRALAYLMGDFAYPDLPAKLWMKCAECGNLYTWKYPQETMAQSEHTAYVYPDHDKYLVSKQEVSGQSLAIWSDILNDLQTYSNGKTLLEVGVGNGKLLAVALEMGYQADAVELVTSIAQNTANILDIPVWNGDFLRYSTNKTYSVIIMGDVIEHIANPTLAMQNAYRLLDEDGVLWLSTPNFESAFSRMHKFDDAMWCEPHHVTYFSYRGFAALAESCGFSVIKYTASKRYNGSMELILKKNADWDGIFDLNLETRDESENPAVGQDSGHSGDFAAETLETLISAGNLQQALDFIEGLPQEGRQRWQIQNLTGIVCALCGQPGEARTFYEAALAQRPEDPEVLYNLADTYAALGMNRKAKEMLDRCQQYAGDGEVMEDIAALRRNMAERKGGRVLMAAYYFPPLSGSGVFRSIKFAKYLPLFGWEPTVISTDRPPEGWKFSDDSQLKEIPEGMSVVRIPDGISTGRETSLDSGRVQAILDFLRSVLRFSPEGDRIFARLFQSREGIMQLLTFPCGALSWAYDVTQYIEKYVDLDQFDVIYTTSGPASAHLIGFYLKQKYGIPWVADYRDPWTFNPYGADYNPDNAGQRFLFELESVLLHGADCNLTIEDSLVGVYEKQFGLEQVKVTSITNGYDEEDFSGLEMPHGRMDKFTINYSGLLYSQQRSIVPVLKAIQQLRDEKKIDLSKLRFRIVGVSEEGNLETAEQYGLAQVIESTGYLSHREAIQANVDANLLLLLVGDEPKFKPVYTGKFFEYLRSGRPILALAPKDGAVDRVLRESGHGEAFLSTQIPKIKSMILREYKKWEQGEGQKLLHSPAIERFERKALTQRLAGVLKNVKSAPPARFLELSDSLYNDAYRSGSGFGSYHRHYKQSFYYPFWQKAMSYLSELEQDVSILEIGCGAGQFANMLFDNGYTNYIGFDYAAEGVALAKQNNPERAGQFVVGDAFQTELMEKEYGLVICFEVLEHVQNDLTLLQRIRPGTRVLLSVPNFNDPYHVRYFKNKDEVWERYSQVVRISDISVSMLTQTNCLYYIWGEKL